MSLILPQPLAGALGVASGIGAAVNTAGFILSNLGGTPQPGQVPGQFPVTLGSITLQGFEVPEKAPWGGAQALTVHKLIGGARVIDAMGVDDRTIQLKGLFLSPDADDRARAVDVLRKAGQPVAFSYGAHVYLVVIKSFTPDFARPDRQEYSLELEVLQDLTQPLQAADPSDDDDFAAGLGGLVGGAASLLGGALGVVGGVFATVNAAAAAVTVAVATANGLIGAVSLGIPSALANFSLAVGSMIGAVSGGIAGPVFTGISTPLSAAGRISASSADNLALMLGPIVAAQQMLALLVATPQSQGFFDTYLAGVPVPGGVQAGANPATAAANLTLSAAVTTAYAQIQQIQAQLAVMQSIIENTGP